ncbi:MAG: hypothetical protein A2Y81_05555 [Nitrospirae bacterium RBG_13_43_8]|nr:MAG: hypothetical protein A2Y81_05555 [Nitrospirae bacterium RBG_13_43_8]
MEVQKDFRELLELFNKHNVEYMIVGGYALAFHGAPRYTGDLDIFIRPDSMNAQRIMRALKDFGFESVGLTEEDFKKPDNVIQLGVPPVRVDIVTSLTGIPWESALEQRVQGRYGDVQVHYIGREQFILNKRSMGRKKDLADIEALGEK